ncbi:MAG: hypothetical protein V4510_08510 [bacterium]
MAVAFVALAQLAAYEALVRPTATNRWLDALAMEVIFLGLAAVCWRLAATAKPRPVVNRVMVERSPPLPKGTGPLHGLQIAAIVVACVGLLFTVLIVVAARGRPRADAVEFPVAFGLGFGAGAAVLWWSGGRARRRRPAPSVTAPVPEPVAAWLVGVAFAALATTVLAALAPALPNAPPTWLVVPVAIAWLLSAFGGVWGVAEATMRLQGGSYHARNWIALVAGGLAVLIFFAEFFLSFPAGSAPAAGPT